MSALSEFYLHSLSSVVQLELLEISHPSFSQTYYLVRNIADGVTVTLETGEVQFFQYFPLRISSIGLHDDLDQGFRIDLGDLGEVLPGELDNIALDGTFDIKPTVKYRTYRSDDLTEPLVGPLTLQVKDIAFTKQGASFEIAAPSLNLNKTGELYKIDRFPMLRGFL